MFEDKKEEIYLSPLTKSPTPTEIKKVETTQNAAKILDYTAIADRLRTISLSHYSHRPGVVNLVYGLNLPTPRNSREIKRTFIKIRK